MCRHMEECGLMTRNKKWMIICEMRGKDNGKISTLMMVIECTTVDQRMNMVLYSSSIVSWDTTQFQVEASPSV